MTMRPLLVTAAGLLALFLAFPSAGVGQAVPARLAPGVFDVDWPSERVEGSLANMRVVRRGCAPRSVPDLRRRIVDIAIQEWAFFGFPVLDRLNGTRLLPGAALRAWPVVFEKTTGRAPRTTPWEGARVASTIAGYWAVTPEGPWIVETQARRWAERGAGTRWNAPWSAAFISWVMCEAGLDSGDRFARAIAHWRYVDQAIEARDGQASAAAYRAYDVGERPVEPGDLLCTARRPRYRDLAERRRQMGEGARTHCDIVVEVDASKERILAIGGNVLRAVSLKVLPGRTDAVGGVRPESTSSRPFYAHLKLQSGPIGLRALADSPVLAAYAGNADALRITPAMRVLDVLGVDAPGLGRQTGR